MIRSMLVATFLLALPVGASAGDNVLSPEEKADGFILLFDGKSLGNWKTLTVRGKEMPVGKSNFSIVDGTLLASGSDKSYWIRYERVFSDTVLRMEYKVSKGANSGIFFRAPGGSAHPAYATFEVQILDDHGKQPDKHGCAAIYDVITPMRNMSKPAGQWNTMEITCKGPNIIVVHNGFKVLDVDFATLTEPIGKFTTPYCKLPGEGYFGVQSHGGDVAFKNIRIKPLVGGAE